MKAEVQVERNPFHAFAMRMLDLHELIAKGKIDSEEADEVRADLDVLWNSLSDEEMAMEKALSENLYHLFASEDELMRQPDIGVILEKRDVLMRFRHFAKSDLPGKLKMVAEVPVNFEPANMFYQRATVFHDLGLVKIAIRFIRRSVAHSNDGMHAFSLLEWVRRYDSSAAAIEEYRRIRSSIARNEDFVDLAYVMARIELSDLEGNPEQLTEAREIAERVNERFIGGREAPEIMGAHGALLLASILERKGDRAGAAEVLRKGYERLPGSHLLKAKYAVSLYDQEPDTSIRLFEELINDQTTNVWPYVFLSHYYLSKARWTEAGIVAAKGLVFTEDSKLKADLLESCGIVLAETGGNWSAAEECFEKALRLDPGNASIRRNFEVLKNRVSSRSLGDFDISERPGSEPNWQEELAGAIGRKLLMPAI